MRLAEIKRLVESTADAAFALSPEGDVAAWNNAAAELFGLRAKDAIGRTCGEVLKGIDECGRTCGESCMVRARALTREPLRNYDVHVWTKDRRQWCNVSVLIVDAARSTSPYTVHIVRPSDMQKRFEMLVKDFIVTETNIPAANVGELLSAKKAPTAATDLTKREVEILKLLAKGTTTAGIAETLFISRTTTNNHIQHIMKKLSAHSRLEAIRRAEQAGLI